MSNHTTPDWDQMADWAESANPLTDDSTPILTGEQATAAGRRFLRGRPNVGAAHAIGTGASRKRATRLDEQTDAALIARARREHKSVSAVIREVLRHELIGSSPSSDAGCHRLTT